MFPHLSTRSRPSPHHSRGFSAFVNMAYIFSTYPPESMSPRAPFLSSPCPHVSIPFARFPALLPRFATLPRVRRFSWTILHVFRHSLATSPLPILLHVSISSRPFPHVSTGSEPTWPASPPELSFGRPSRIIFRDLIAGHPDRSV